MNTWLMMMMKFVSISLKACELGMMTTTERAPISRKAYGLRRNYPLYSVFRFLVGI